MFKKLVIISIFLSIIGCDNKKSQELRLGISADYPPFTFQANEHFTGFDVELAQEIAKELNLKLVIKDMDFASLIPALKSNKIDMIMSGLTMTPERASNVDFSEPYYVPSFAVVYLKTSHDIMNIHDLIGKTIGTQMGSTMAIYLETEAKTLGDLNVVLLNKNNQLIQELVLGRIDGVLIEHAQAKAFAGSNERLEYQSFDADSQGYAAAFKKYSPFREKFNQALNKLKSEQVIEKLEKKWLDTNE